METLTRVQLSSTQSYQLCPYKPHTCKSILGKQDIRLNLSKNHSNDKRSNDSLALHVDTLSIGNGGARFHETTYLQVSDLRSYA